MDNQTTTIARAAEMLGMSREFLRKLIDAGVMPEHKIGETKFIYLQDVLAYQTLRDKARGAALRRISQAAAEAGLYDSNKFPEGGLDE